MQVHGAGSDEMLNESSTLSLLQLALRSEKSGKRNYEDGFAQNGVCPIIPSNCLYICNIFYLYRQE